MVRVLTNHLNHRHEPRLNGGASLIARDAFGYSLNYFTNDYQPINTAVTPFAAIASSLRLSNTGASLYNGNIRAMLVNIPALSNGTAYLYGYRYDQLNRIVGMDAFTGLASNNSFTARNTTDYRERISYDPNGNIKTYLRNGATQNSTAPLPMDNLTYQYEKNSAGQTISNKLRYVHDQIADANYTNDINSQTTLSLPQVLTDNNTLQTTDNYAYDAIGNLTKDTKEGISNIDWTVYGKIKTITKTNGTVINYTYDASGNRITKTVIPSGGGASTTYYVRDASGNTMSVYSGTIPPSGGVGATIPPLGGVGGLSQTEIHLYGSSRLGINNVNIDVTPAANTSTTTIFTRGNKFFELSNHLGNVLVTVSDKKLQYSSNTTSIDYYKADVITANDYAPFGMALVGRKFTQVNSGYRYGFNGKELDIDMDGSNYDYGFRIYNPQLGKFLSVDPLTSKYAFYTPYQFAGNKPTVYIDIDGKEEGVYDPSQDPYNVKRIWDNAVDGLSNVLLMLTIPQTEGLLIRKVLEKQGYKIPNAKYISDSYLSKLFDIHKENRTFVVVPERKAVEKLIELGFSALDVLAVLPTGGSPYILAAKISPSQVITIENIIKDVRIGTRAKEIESTFLDLTRDVTGSTKISTFEAESAALLEQTDGIKLRGLNQGEAGDYAFESGILNGKSVASKTIDQLGIPISAVGKFRIGDLTNQITKHFNKKGVDFILLDGRNLSSKEKTSVMEYIKTNHANDLNRLITIGF
ncbi:MAG: RHS repeat-associated core domain-containing protein [Flavobacterium sp.]|nr:RHS repeat-associated core domain-containing protein [Flavobacterium sp.]